jgi:ABC-2 type transport system ATP-binding protein
MLTGRVVPTGGLAEVAGIDVWQRTELAKQVIGVVPQSNTLDRALTVRDNLYHHGRYFGMGRKESRVAADQLLEQFRLTERADAPVLALSGGMAQRLMVARAIMHGPSVLVLDEPTTGLDPQSRLALWDILRDLRTAGQTIVLTTHYMEEAEQLCDRLAIIDHGRLLKLGTPAELIDEVGGDVVVTVSIAAAEGAAARLAGTLAALAEVSSAEVAGDTTVRAVVAERDGALPAIVAASDADGVELRDLSVAEPSLETVFIELTGRELRD